MTQTTSRRIGLTVTPDRLTLPPDGRGELALIVSNQGAVVDSFDLVVEGIDPSWYTVTTPSVSLFPDATGTLGLTVHLPAPPIGSVSGGDGVAGSGVGVAAGLYRLQLRVVSRDDASAAATAEATLNVLPVGTLRVELVPQRVTLSGLGAPGAWARYRFRLINEGNAERLLDVTVADDEDVLLTRLDADRLPVPPGETREVAVALRPKRRPWIARPRSIPFTATATAAAGEATESVVVEGMGGMGAPGEVMGVAPGELNYLAPLAFLAGLPLWLQRLLPLLLLLALLLPILAWLLGGAGMQSPFRPRPTPALQTVVPTPEVLSAQAAIATVAAQQTVAARAGGAAGGAAGAGAQTPAQQTAAAAAAQIPAIASFELRTPAGGGRGEFELAWDVQRAEGLRILDVRGTQKTPIEGVTNAPTGTVRIQTLEDREFELEATNRAGTARRSIGVVILRPPEIVAFTADPVEVERGQPTTLSWEARRPARAAISGVGDVPGDPRSGSIAVPVNTDTVFTLVVVNDLGREERSVTVRVR